MPLRQHRPFTSSASRLAEAEGEGKGAAAAAEAAEGKAEHKEAGEAGAATKESAGAETTEADGKDKLVAELRDQLMRSMADYRNLQNRTTRDVQAARDFALQKFARDLVESVDNFGRALNTVPEEHRADSERNKELVDLYNGLKMTEQVLLKTLEKHGISRFDGIGDEFNPNIHEAVFQVPMPGKEPNTVFHCESTGFMLNGRVIRPAKVGVVQSTDN